MIKSYLDTMNVLLDGGFREKEIYALFGEASVGKSLYLMGEAISLIKNGVRVIWVDTEGGWEGLWNKFSGELMKRFGVTDTEVKTLFTHKRILGAEEFCKYFGMKMEIIYGSKAQVQMNGWEAKNDSVEAYQIVGRKKNQVALIIDSFSSPSKLEIPTNVQNFSGRADLQSLMILSVLKFMDKTDAFSIITGHESKNPTDIWHSNPIIRGGSTVRYYSKYIIYFEKQKKKVLSDHRKLVGVRTPVAKDWDLFGWVRIDNTGYYDSNSAEVENIINSSKQPKDEN